MKYIILIFTLSLFLTSCCDCDKSKEKPKPVISGKMTWVEWQKVAEWKSYSATNYKPSESLVNRLKMMLKDNQNISFIMFSASWCSDSESEVPKFYKLMELCDVGESRIEFYGVDRQKKEATGTADKYKIYKVPTLIILKDNAYLGKVVEFPVLSWEDDLITLLESINE